MSDTTTPADDAIRVYWMTGCSSCLRTKEFLTRHNVPFLSRNVLEDEGAFDELAVFGLRQVPIVTRGGRYANGQVLRDVAAISGIPWGDSKVLPVQELRERQAIILSTAERLLAPLPEDALQRQLPRRPRSYADLAFHIFNIPDAVLEHEAGQPLTFDSYMRVPGSEMQRREALLAYGADVRRRLAEWFAANEASRDWSARADVYYGEQTLHEYLERTVWHSGQHVRQLAWVLEGLGIPPSRPLGREIFDGLPMPEKVWDDENAKV